MTPDPLHAGARPVRICIYAFSTTALFFRALIEACAKANDAVEWSVILPQGHFRNLFADALPAERVCYLYQDFTARYRACTEDDVQRALEAGEGAVTALMKDKDGYRRLDKDEQLRRAASIHGRYSAFLERMRPDFVLFPDLEVVDGFLLMNLCQRMRIGVLYCTDMRFLGRAFFASDPYETLPPYFGSFDSGDLAAARAVLRGFRDRQIPHRLHPASPPPIPPLWRRIVVSSFMRWRHERLHASEEGVAMRIKRNLIGVTTRVRRLRFDLAAARYFDPVERLPAKYIYYALHYTPESSINGLEPFYVDQLRAVDLLLLNLPAGHRLAVKEHPGMYGVRPLAFYRALRRRPGLVLLHPSVDSRMLAQGAALVATVTGTVGLEAYVMGKPCLCLGRNFFAHLCGRPSNLRDLRGVIEEMIATHAPPSQAEMEIEIAKLLNVGGEFLIGDPWFNPTVMSRENVAAARAHLWRHMARLAGGAECRKSGS